MRRDHENRAEVVQSGERLFDFDGAGERNILLRRNRRRREQKKGKEEAAGEHVKTILQFRARQSLKTHTAARASSVRLDKLKLIPQNSDVG
jgi:hypothetical protein